MTKPGLDWGITIKNQPFPLNLTYDVSFISLGIFLSPRVGLWIELTEMVVNLWIANPCSRVWKRHLRAI